MRKLVVRFQDNGLSLVEHQGFDVFESDGAYLIYSFLPIGLDKFRLVEAFKQTNIDFNETASGHYLLVFIEFVNSIPRIKILQDRFGSEVVFFKHDTEELTVVTSWLETELVDSNKLFNHQILQDVSRTRLNDPRSPFFNLEGQWQELLFGNAIQICGDKTELHRTPTERFFYPSNQSKLTGQEAANRIENELEKTLIDVSKLSSKCAVLLSGGVDSFILLALAKKHFSEVTAYSPKIENANNEELERAIVMAEHLGVQHEIVEVSDRDVSAACNTLLKSIGRPIRNFSSLIYPRLFSSIKETFVFYGLNADILFGDKDIKTQLIDYKYKTIIECVPEFLRTAKVKAALSRLAYGVSRLGILGLGTENERRYHSILSALNFEGNDQIFMQEQMPTASKVTQFNWSKKLIFDTECRLHMLEIEASAHPYRKQVITPFYSKEMNQISASLSFEQLFGNSGISVLKNFKRDNRYQCKPLIKLIASKYISEEIVYKRKLDFPTPYARWMAEIFNDRPEIDLDDLPVQTYWTYYNLLKLQCLAEQTKRY